MSEAGAIVFEAEIEDDRLIPIERSHLMWGRCRCGAAVLVAPGQRGRCSSCGLADAGHASPLSLPEGRELVPLGTGYPPKPPEAPEAYPVPLVTSRDEWDGSDAPSPVLKLAEKARAASWDVRVQRSRGCAPHASTGRPGAVKWRYAVVLASEDRRWSAYAVYAETGWASVMLWGAERPWFPSASVTDLAEYLAAGGEMGEEWYAGIRSRLAAADERARLRKLCDRGEHPGGVRIERLVTCSTCGNSWVFGTEPWRKPRKGSGEAL